MARGLLRRLEVPRAHRPPAGHLRSPERPLRVPPQEELTPGAVCAGRADGCGPLTSGRALPIAGEWRVSRPLDVPGPSRGRDEPHLADFDPVSMGVNHQ